MNNEVQVLDTGQDTDTSTYTPYEMIEFENGTLVTPASADLETGQVTMPVYSGKAPINATNLNHLEQGLKNLEEYILSGGVIGGGGGNAPIGSVMIWHGSTAPSGYLICDGTTYSKSQYPDLYDALGSDYQISAEQFKVPDFRGLIPIGAGTHQDTNSKSKTFTLGTEYGEYEHTQTIEELVNHRHNSRVQWANSAGNGVISTSTNNTYLQVDAQANNDGLTGGGQPFNVMQPSLAVNFIIKAIKSDSTLAEVENSLASDSTTNAPSINAVNTALNKLGTRMLIFEGTGNMNTAITINTTWEALGKFKNLTVELQYATNNNCTTVTFPFELLSDGINLANSARVTNVYMPIVSIVDRTFGKIHLVPSNDVTSNTIKFDGFDASITIARMWVEY